MTLGVVALEAGQGEVRAVRINWRNCVVFIEWSSSSVALSNVNLEVERDAGVYTIVWLGVPGGIRIPVSKVEAGIDVVDMLLCGRRKEKSSDKAVKGKRWSIALATTVARKEKNVMSAARGSETAIGFPEESRNPIPCRLPTTKKAWRTESTIRSVSRSTEPVSMTKYAAIVAVKSLIVTEGEEERERMRWKKRIEIIALW